MPTLERLGVDALRATLRTFRDLLRTHAARIDRLNVYPVPDGDTGTNMSRTLDAVVAEMDGAPDDLTSTCDAIAHGALMGARGNSGVITSQLLRGIASSLKSAGEATPDSVAAALTAASQASYQAVLKPIEGTILTVARRAAEAASDAAADGADLLTTLRHAREVAGQALDETPQLLPVLADAGVVDAGGAGFLLLLDAAAHVVGGDELPEPPTDVESLGPVGAQFDAVAHRHDADGGVDVSEQRYEVMYLLDLDDGRIEDFKQGWGAIGDSIVVVGGDGLWNCHVHTNDIGAAVEVALDLDGRPRQIRVTDLFEEVASEHAAREATVAHAAGGDAGGADELPPVTCAVVAVSNGEGISTLFRQLGVQAIVGGGQSANPSTAELLAAVERVNADHVIVLPNNKNIIAVAEQLDAVTAKTVRVVPTRSMPEGMAALIEYDPEADAPLNRNKMAMAAEAIATGEVTQAVRASKTPAGDVRIDDWIGLVRGDGVVAVADDVVDAATSLLEQIVTPEREIVSVFTGAGAAAADVGRVESWLAEQRPDVDVEVHEGGQPLYPFVFGVE